MEPKDVDLMDLDCRERGVPFEMAAPPRRLRSNFIDGVKQMQVRFAPVPVAGGR